MAFNFRAVDRDQQFLMPPSMADWLPEDHLAWFLFEVVEQLDLSQFDERYRGDGRGAPAYDPSMMTALWLYAYCAGEKSSRQMERRCIEDVPFRVIAANPTSGPLHDREVSPAACPRTGRALRTGP